METLIEHLISDFQERDLPRMQAREAKLPQIPGKIDAIVGMRRVGKTSLLYQVMQQQLAQGLPKKNILYMNFDDERLLPLTVDRLHLIPDTYYRMFPELKKERCYFFLDEIQNIDGWERFVRRLLDTENVQLAITGSSSKLLSKEIATALRGRALTTEVFPYSFKETLIHENPTFSFAASPGAQARAWLANRARQFLQLGGFPEVQGLAEEYRIKILQEYVDVVILRDIIERYNVANVQVLRAMVRSLLAAPAALFSVNKFYNDLRSQGISCSKNDLYDYLDYLHDAYLIFPISICARSVRVQRTNPRKVYLIDAGLIHAFLHQPHADFGHLLENWVYLELRRQGFKVEYFRTQKGAEVDFIATSNRGEQALYQVALNLDDARTRAREIRALEDAMQELRISESKIVTLNHRETIRMTSGIIEAVPAWQLCFDTKAKNL